MSRLVVSKYGQNENGEITLMGEVSIPFALDPYGVEVPIEEAVRGRVDYYVCPECGNAVTPRKGEKRIHYYAHKQGVLEDGECELSSKKDVDQMVDNLRTSDIELTEQSRKIRVYLGEEPGGRHRLFGVIPSTDWEQFPPGVDVESIFDQCSVTSEGITYPPSGRSFHPSEAEVSFELDIDADEYHVRVDGPDELKNITGDWSADAVSKGDLFVGDQTRARRQGLNRQVKLGEWVYAVTENTVEYSNEEMSIHSLGDLEILSFPAREDTEEILSDFGKGLRTDKYGFDSDVILPANAHPTADKPIDAPAGSTVLIGVTPAEEIDPIFEIVSIPKRKGDTVELSQTGPGNTRFYRTTVPKRGSRRVSVHQQNSSRHRLIHLHAAETDNQPSEWKEDNEQIGISLDLEEGRTFLSPVEGPQSVEIGQEVSPATLPELVDYRGPEGMELEIRATFPSDTDMGVVERKTTDLQSELMNVGHWVTQGCTEVSVTFEGVGSVSIRFPNQSEVTV